MRFLAGPSDEALGGARLFIEDGCLLSRFWAFLIVWNQVGESSSSHTGRSPTATPHPQACPSGKNALFFSGWKKRYTKIMRKTRLLLLPTVLHGKPFSDTVIMEVLPVCFCEWILRITGHASTDPAIRMFLNHIEYACFDRIKTMFVRRENCRIFNRR